MLWSRFAKSPIICAQNLLFPRASLRNSAPQTRPQETRLQHWLDSEASLIPDWDMSLFLKMNNKGTATANTPGVSDSETEHVGHGRGPRAHTCLPYHVIFTALAKHSKVPMLTVLADGCAHTWTNPPVNKDCLKQKLCNKVFTCPKGKIHKCRIKQFIITCVELLTLVIT